MKTILSSLVMQAAMFAVTSVYSAEEVTRHHSFNLSDISEVEIRGSVGRMEISLVDGDEIRLTLEIEGKDGGWFRRTKDVSDVDLESSLRGDRLILRMDEDDTNTDWSVELPVVAITRIDLGVGEIRAEVGATELELNLGVGEAVVDAEEASTGRIDLSVGVGEARVTGTRGIESERSFVSQELTAYGRGELPIEMHVGVGEARVNLK